MRPGTVADHYNPFSVEIKNEQSCNFPSSDAFVIRTRATKAIQSITIFARVICTLFFSILAAEKLGCVKYADFLWRS